MRKLLEYLYYTLLIGIFIHIIIPSVLFWWVIASIIGIISVFIVLLLTSMSMLARADEQECRNG